MRTSSEPVDHDIIIVDPSQDVIFSSKFEESRPFLVGAKRTLRSIQRALQSAPAFINAVKACVPEHTLQAVLTDEQKQKLADGAVKFMMRKKDGSIIGTLVSTSGGQIDSHIALKDVASVPNLTQALASFQAQMQMARIAEQLCEVQSAIEDVRKGQELDRLATAYSCRQKLQQAMLIRNPELRNQALLNLAFDAEDSRNLLMLSQKSVVNLIMQEPESFFGKMFHGSSPEEMQKRFDEIRDSLEAVDMVSLAQAIAYQEMGEIETAKQSLLYFATFIQQVYLSHDGFVERLDLLDPSPVNYWSEMLPEIQKKISALPCMSTEIRLIESEADNG